MGVDNFSRRFQCLIRITRIQANSGFQPQNRIIIQMKIPVGQITVILAIYILSRIHRIRFQQFQSRIRIFQYLLHNFFRRQLRKYCRKRMFDVRDGNLRSGGKIPGGIHSQNIEMNKSPESQCLSADNCIIISLKHILFEFRILYQRINIRYNIIHPAPHLFNPAFRPVFFIIIIPQIIIIGIIIKGISASPFLSEYPNHPESQFFSVQFGFRQTDINTCQSAFKSLLRREMSGGFFFGLGFYIQPIVTRNGKYRNDGHVKTQLQFNISFIFHNPVFSIRKSLEVKTKKPGQKDILYPAPLLS